MNKFAAAALGAAAMFALAGCETGRHYGAVDAAYVGPGYVDGYYDDSYGSVYDGYWGTDDAFYYRASPTGDFRRDDAHHFRHDTAQGFHNMHMRAGHVPQAAAQGGDHHDDRH